MNSEPGDYELALRAQQGNPDALAELVARTRMRLFALAYAELRHYDDAQDAVAAALLQICRHVKELREPQRIREWMNSIVRNEVRRLRRRAGAPTLRLEETDGRVEDASPSLLRLDIARAMRQLPEDHARVSRLFYLADLSIADIARQTGRPEGTIKSWLHRGRQRLALEMEEYAPMTPTPTPTPEPPQVAALVHTDLKPTLVRKITDALRTGGYRTKVLIPTDPARLLDSLKEYQAVLLDESIAGRTAFEFLAHMRARSETRLIPVGVLCSDPSEFTVSAYFAAGVGRLINKNHQDDLSKLAERFERPVENLWARFTERARQLIFFAQEEAGALGETWVGTEHLLLGLTRVPESVGAQILIRLEISLESIRETVMQQVTRGPGKIGLDKQLTPRAKRVIDLAYEEARRLRNNYLGVEHLLLGMLGEGDGLAYQVLAKLGVTLERVRTEVQTLQAP